MRRTQDVTIGQIVFDDFEILGYELDQSDNGMCYKDLSAWVKGEGIIYIAECNGINYGGFISVDDVEENVCWTKDTWLEYVKEVVDYYNDDNYAVLSAEEQAKVIEYIAYNCLCECDWQDLSTELDSWSWEDCIEEIIKDCIKK